MIKSLPILPFLLAKAAEEMLPEAHLTYTSASGYSFEANFSFPTEIDATILAHIEAKMRVQLRGISFEIKTFLKENGAAFLESCNRKNEAARVRATNSQCVQLITIDKWVAVCPYEHIEPLSSIPEIALIEAVSEDKQLLVRGIFGRDKKEVRARTAIFRGAPNLMEELKKQHMLLPFSERALLLSVGQNIASSLQTLWRTYSAAKTPLSFPLESRDEMAAIMNDKGFSSLCFWGYLKTGAEYDVEGFLPLKANLSDYSCYRGDDAACVRESTSTLQFINKIYSLFGLTCTFCLFSRKKGAGILEKAFQLASLDLETAFEFEVVPGDVVEQAELVSFDARGRQVPLARVQIKKTKGEQKIVAESVFLSVERTIALVVEQRRELSRLLQEPQICVIQRREEKLESQ